MLFFKKRNLLTTGPPLLYHPPYIGYMYNKVYSHLSGNQGFTGWGPKVAQHTLAFFDIHKTLYIKQ
jgi:hypothetical protein